MFSIVPEPWQRGSRAEAILKELAQTLLGGTLEEAHTPACAEIGQCGLFWQALAKIRSWPQLRPPSGCRNTGATEGEDVSSHREQLVPWLIPACPACRLQEKSLSRAAPRISRQEPSERASWTWPASRPPAGWYGLSSLLFAPLRSLRAGGGAEAGGADAEAPWRAAGFPAGGSPQLCRGAVP